MFWYVCVCVFDNNSWSFVSGVCAKRTGLSGVPLCLRSGGSKIADFRIGSLCQTDTTCIFLGDCQTCADFFCCVSETLETYLLLGVQVSRDISSIRCLSQLGNIFCWVFGPVGIFSLLSIQVSWDISSLGCQASWDLSSVGYIGQLGHSSVECLSRETAMHASRSYDQ